MDCRKPFSLNLVSLQKGNMHGFFSGQQSVFLGCRERPGGQGKQDNQWQGFWQAGLHRKFEKTASYTLIPTKRELSILQDGGTWKAAARKEPLQGGNLSHRCVPGILPSCLRLLHLARTQSQKLDSTSSLTGAKPSCGNKKLQVDFLSSFEQLGGLAGKIKLAK